jgi:protein SCO1
MHGLRRWIEKVQKIAPESIAQLQPGTNSTGPVKFRKSPVVEALEVGDQVPDWKFTNHLGQPISLGQFRGKALGLTFIFTRCPLPTYCPRMSGNFSSAARILSTNGAGVTNWMFLSLSFDPEFDTPPRLAAYAKTYSPDTNRWQFATGDFWNVDGLTEQLGLTFWKADGTINHNLRTAVIDTRGRLHKVFIGNEWKSDEFAEEMLKAARAQ